MSHKSLLGRKLSCLAWPLGIDIAIEMNVPASRTIWLTLCFSLVESIVVTNRSANADNLPVQIPQPSQPVLKFCFKSLQNIGLSLPSWSGKEMKIGSKELSDTTEIKKRIDRLNEALMMHDHFYSSGETRGRSALGASLEILIGTFLGMVGYSCISSPPREWGFGLMYSLFAGLGVGNGVKVVMAKLRGPNDLDEKFYQFGSAAYEILKSSTHANASKDLELDFIIYLPRKQLVSYFANSKTSPIRSAAWENYFKAQPRKIPLKFSLRLESNFLGKLHFEQTVAVINTEETLIINDDKAKK